MRRLTSVLLLLLFFLTIAAQPKYKVRAAWITTAYGLDWPHTRATDPQSIRKQKQELTEILDRLKIANFNTVLFQARTRGDVFYPSAIEPFSSLLTGKTGGNPGYDPLAFVIEECHKRGMECHAWMVAIPLGNKSQVNSLGNRSVVRQKKDLCVTYKNEYFLNPGHPGTKVYLMKLVQEIVSNYDIDGIHLDYLRYPENATTFPDRNDYRRRNEGRSLEQWRRDNLSEIVRYIYKGVKAMKPWVKVSTCPVGKFRDTTRYSSKGWNAFYTVCQDPQGWLNEGIMDQIYPMMYFQGNNFYPFALDWQEQSNGRHIIPGLGIYFLDPKEGNWKLEEIERQLYFIRKHQMAGEGFFRTQHLMDNTQGIYDALTDRFYTYPALQPPMPWLDSTPPSAPTDGTVRQTEDGYTELTWQPATDNDTQNPPTYVIYASDTRPVDTGQAQNIVAVGIRVTSYLYAPLLPWEKRKYFAVTAVDRYGNESEAIQL